MRWKTSKLAGTAAIALMVSGCGSRSEERSGVDPVRPQPQQSGGYGAEEPIRIGEPYDINGKRYEPRDDVTHDEVGIAGVMQGWDGAGADPATIGIAHRTLPVPSYVEVTHLGSGKTILARVVNRGPFVNDRVADLSPAAARLLGIQDMGAPVRVRRVNPPEAEKAALRQGRAAPARLDTPPALLSALRRKMNDGAVSGPREEMGTAAPSAQAAKPVATAPKAAPPKKGRPKPGADFSTAPKPAPAGPAPAREGRFILEGAGASVAPEAADAAPAPSSAPKHHRVPAQQAGGGRYFVQIGSFSDPALAEAMASKAGAQVQQGDDLYRVRFGPFGSREEAEATLSQVRNKGYPQARIAR